MGNLGKKFFRKEKVKKEDDKKRNEVRKEFKLKFEKKLQNIYLLK